MVRCTHSFYLSFNSTETENSDTSSPVSEGRVHAKSIATTKGLGRDGGNDNAVLPGKCSCGMQNRSTGKTGGDFNHGGHNDGDGSHGVGPSYTAPSIQIPPGWTLVPLPQVPHTSNFSGPTDNIPQNHPGGPRDTINSPSMHH